MDLTTPPERRQLHAQHNPHWYPARTEPLHRGPSLLWKMSTMRSFISTLVLPSLLTSVLSREVSTDKSLDGSGLPPCAQLCYTALFRDSTCSSWDQSCICIDVDLATRAGVCLREHCTVTERLASRRIFSERCLLPVQNKGFIVTTIAVVGGVLASISVALRLYARLSRQGGKMMMDDITVISTLVLVIPTSAAAITAVEYGLGQDIWMLTPSQITSFFKVFYVAEALYALCVFFAKTNFLFFYLRVFPGEKFCSITRLLIGVCLAAGVSLSTATVFQCTPVSYAWTRWDGEHEGKCHSINLQTWTNAAINIVLDIVILAMPITQLVRVNFHWKEKLGAVLMFALGFFITIISVIRLQTIASFQTTPNPTWDILGITYWSLIELDVCVICACIPALRDLVRRKWGRSISSRNVANRSSSSSTRIAARRDS